MRDAMRCEAVWIFSIEGNGRVPLGAVEENMETGDRDAEKLQQYAAYNICVKWTNMCEKQDEKNNQWMKKDKDWTELLRENQNEAELALELRY